jgi:hypothetical protein
MKTPISIKKKFGEYGTNFILTPHQYLICFSDETDDLIVKSKFSYKTDKVIVFGDDEIFTEEQISGWLNNFTQLIGNPIVDEFSLSKTYIDGLRDSIGYYNITHLRFFTENNKIIIRLFDYRKFVYEITFINGGYVETTIKNVDTVETFSFTINSSSFLKLPLHDYTVEVLENGIVDFISLNEEIEFFYRDQEIQEPVVKFVNAKLGQEICLLLHPKTI